MTMPFGGGGQHCPICGSAFYGCSKVTCICAVLMLFVGFLVVWLVGVGSTNVMNATVHNRRFCQILSHPPFP